MKPNRHPLSRLSARLLQLARGEAGAAVLLLAAAGMAIVLANSPWHEAYHHLIHGRLAWSPVAKLDTLELWINDALMAVFFFVIGLEIKREVLDGELANAARRRLPVLAAVAGMALPALVYLAIAGQQAGLGQGWAIPAATDIAFAVGVLALVGRGLPPSLRLFLLTVAIVDDLGAVAIIALVYTPGIDLAFLALAAGLLAALAVLGWRRHAGWALYALLGIGLWLAVLHSGVHATIAGVLAAFTIPLRPSRTTGDSLLLRLEHGLAPWNAYVIVPLFGFANAGVALGAQGLRAAFDPLPLGVAAGLFLGKQLGVLGAILLAERTGFAQRPAGATLKQLWGVAALCGIGFTMSLFITNLAFPGAAAVIETAKLGIVCGSLAAAVLGFALLRSSRK